MVEIEQVVPVKELKPINYKGWIIKFIKFNNGYVRAVGLHNGKMYMAFTHENKEQSENYTKKEIDNYIKFNLVKAVQPLDEQAYKKKY